MTETTDRSIEEELERARSDYLAVSRGAHLFSTPRRSRGGRGACLGAPRARPSGRRGDHWQLTTGEPARGPVQRAMPLRC